MSVEAKRPPECEWCNARATGALVVVWSPFDFDEYLACDRHVADAVLLAKSTIIDGNELDSAAWRPFTWGSS